jgi:hypothetical protein
MRRAAPSHRRQLERAVMVQRLQELQQQRQALQQAQQAAAQGGQPGKAGGPQRKKVQLVPADDEEVFAGAAGASRCAASCELRAAGARCPAPGAGRGPDRWHGHGPRRTG